MKITEEDRDHQEISFSFTLDKEELIKQANFLCSYYTAKLKVLRGENQNLYITAEQAAEEVFYKDMIASCMLFIEESKHIKRINHANTDQQS